jgi:hypothetical protein
MIRQTATIAATIWAALSCNPATGQTPPPAILTIDLAGYVEYQADVYDPSKYGKNPDLTPSAGIGLFGVATQLADIVAVNGQPAKGIYVGRSRGVSASPTPHQGALADGAIGDIAVTALREHVFEILRPDGTVIGTIVSMGFSGGPVPPGSPSGPSGGNWAIVGGTGAFLGARGQIEGWGGTGFAKAQSASMTEDPFNRRLLHQAGIFRFTLHLIPMYVPEILPTANGPAVVHSNDFTLVSASKPATAGEVLSLFVTGLGPVNPNVDPGQPFPSSPLDAVNSPVDVIVNGKPSEVLGTAGYPGSVDGYQVNFRLPPGIGKGTASIQVTAAWVSGPSVSIAVQ